MSGTGIAGTPGVGLSARDSDAREARTVILWVVVLGILWGSAFPVIRAGLVAGAAPLVFAAIRYALTAVALVAIALGTRAELPRARDLLAPMIFGGLLMIGLYGGLLYLGEGTTPGGLAAVLTASAPLASAVLGYRWFPSERFGNWGTAGLAVGFVGVGILVLPQLVVPSVIGFEGPALVVGAVLAFSVGSVLLRRTSRTTPGLWTLSVQFATAAALVSALALATGEPLALGNGSTVLPALTFLVVLPGIFGYSLYFHLHHRAGPSRANIVGYVNPVTGVVVGLLLFAEVVTAVEIAGLLLIAGGLFLLQRDRARSAASARARPPVAGLDLKKS